MERRSFTGDVGTTDTGAIFGYAAVFQKRSHDLGGFVEEIAPGFFDSVVSDPGVVALANHDSRFLLGRQGAGTLRLTVDSVGLRYEVTPPETRADIRESILRGDMTGSSFGFTIEEEDWQELEGGLILRTLKVAKKLFDVGPVVFPAYPDTTTAARNYDAFLKEIKERENEGELSNLLRYRIKLYEHSIIV